MPNVQHTGKIVSIKKVSPKFFHLSMQCDEALKRALPGQFVHLKVQKSLQPFFRRPFSISRAKKTLDILFEVVGPGTRILSQKKKGELIDFLGPLGTPFRMPSKKIKKIVMVAGGIGVAPFMFLTDRLKQKKDLQVTLFYGARTKEHTFSLQEFRKNGCRVFVSTDDGSVGVKGRVSKLFDKINTDKKDTFIYTCGPKPMMKSVQDFAKKYHLDGQASCEEVMACGLGICLGCAVKLASGMKTACFDGPVFDLKEVVF